MHDFYLQSAILPCVTSTYSLWSSDPSIYYPCCCSIILNPYWYISSSLYSNASYPSHFPVGSISEALNYGSALSACLTMLSRHTTKTSPTPIYLQNSLQSTWQLSVLSHPTQVPLIFLFVCLDINDLKALHDALVVSLYSIPPYALRAGLITFGMMVCSPIICHIVCMLRLACQM